MKIAYDAKRFFHNSSGLGNYSRDLIRVFASYFPEKQLVLLNKNSSERGKEILSMQNVEFVEIEKGIMARQLKMGKKAEEIQADIFHGLSGELPIVWSSKPIKKIVTIHDLIFVRYPRYYSWFDRKIHLWKFKKATQIADKVVAISEQTKQDIIKYLQIPEEKIEVVYQGCHPAFKQTFENSFLNQIKEKYNLPNNFILSVGTIEPRKNLLSVVKAIKGKNIPLIAIGKKQKNYFTKIKKIVDKYQIPVSFIDVDTMEDLAAIYRLATIFVYVSEFEGFGIPVIEALYSGTAVITSNTSAMPEAGGNAAMYVDPNNEKDIAAKIDFLWNLPNERLRRIEIGKIYAHRFDDENIANEWNRIYTKLLEK